MSLQNNPAGAFLDLTPTSQDFLDDVVAGLSKPHKSLPCKYFYDRRGSELFDQICGLEEYYPTRTELRIMRRHADDIARALGPDVMLVEFGSGSSTKTRVLLDHLRKPAAYVPVDISRSHLLRSAQTLSARYPTIEILPVSADFTEPFELPEPEKTVKRRVVYFPGSTIGNFAEPAALRLLGQIAELCGPCGGLLIGIDLKKDAKILEAAYDDREGVTAEFNRNILHRINRELAADFDVDEFEHRAVYAPESGRVEIFLVSRCRQRVTVDDETFEFEAGEAICTEHSHKYEIDEFAALARKAGIDLSDTWTDDSRMFAVLLLTRAAE